MDRPSTEETTPREGWKFVWQPNLLVIYAITLTAIQGVSSLTPAFPTMAEALDATPEKIGLLVTFFTLPGVVLTPVLGILADRWGRKRILVPSLFLFGVAGFACSFAQDLHLLIMLRFLQGIGAASLGSLNVTLIGDLFAGRQRSRAMGYNASVLSIGTASYPLVGGALATFGWFYPFYLPLLAIPVGLFVLLGLRNPEPKGDQTIGEYLKAAWRSVKRRQVIGLFLASTFTFIILYGAYITYFPFLVKQRFEGSALMIGIIMSAMSITTAITSSRLGAISKVIPEHLLVRLSFVLYAVSCILIPFMPGYGWLLLPVLLFGVAQGINIPSIMTLLAGMAPLNQRGAVMSLNGMVLRLGQTLGPLLMGFVFTGLGLSPVFWAGAVAAVIMVIIATAMIRPTAPVEGN